VIIAGTRAVMRILKVLTTYLHDLSDLGDIRTRQLGGKMFMELDLAFEDGWTVAKTRTVVAKIAEAVKRELREAGDDADVAVVLIPGHTAAAEPAPA
jgi:divalent metal cation (Fe/Co/Zn/Cd) transporter